METVYRSAVVGLGNIGFRLSLDTRRQSTWSHVDAYLRSGRTVLAGTVEINPATAREFRALHPEIPVYPTIQDLFREQRIDIISIAVPTALHFPVFQEIATSPVKAVFCEKPLSDSPRHSREMIRIAGEKGMVLAVNYSRRWENSYQKVRDMVQGGEIGALRSVHAFYSGRILAMGSHILDSLRMITGLEPVAVSARTVVDAPDPSLTGWMECRGGIIVTFSATGREENLIFELDLFGDRGRLTIGMNGKEIAWGTFGESQRYSTYKEAVQDILPLPEQKDRFVEAVRDIVAVLDGEKDAPACTGNDGLWVDTLIDAALRSAGRGGVPVPIGDTTSGGNP
ncbi:MAG: Gfo/Idh/MocA family oxidoreductase [Methanomicrobiales archaeon]|nr:Gfo/Idh/MocA family oxidoreductase [Methanomicrobiales archaeon]MDD1655159.1 Gfo/Idh/MocA family oxidoreductase [Methanomicrobiales archaeon]